MYCKVYWSNFKFSKRCLKNMLPIQLKQISENYLPQKNVFHIIFKLFSKKPFLSCLHLNGVIERLIVRHNLVTGFKLVLFILFTCHLTCQPKNGCGNPETKNSRQSGNIDEAKRQPVKNVFFLSQKCFFCLLCEMMFFEKICGTWTKVKTSIQYDCDRNDFVYVLFWETRTESQIFLIVIK